MILGKIQPLTIIEKNDQGFQLEDTEKNQIFIPLIFSENHWKIGDMVEVFIYEENEKIRATTEIPLAQTGEFAVMKCTKTLASGAFVDWGIIKDLFIPYKEQKGKMQEGKDYLIYVYLDPLSGKITGTTKFKKHFSSPEIHLKKGEKISLILHHTTPLGWNVIINQKYWGLLYFSEIYKDLKPLTTEIGYIKNIRDDGKIDVSLQPLGFDNFSIYTEKILTELKKNYGILHLSDHSSPEEIKQELEMSKKNFKKAIGILYKEKKIKILEEKIILL